MLVGAEFVILGGTNWEQMDPDPYKTTADRKCSHCRFKHYQVHHCYFETLWHEYDVKNTQKKIDFKSRSPTFTFLNPQWSCKILSLITMWPSQLSVVTLNRDWPTPELKVLNLALSYVSPLPLLKCYKFKRQSGNYDSRKVHIFRRQFDEIADWVLLSQ